MGSWYLMGLKVRMVCWVRKVQMGCLGRKGSWYQMGPEVRWVCLDHRGS